MRNKTEDKAEVPISSLIDVIFLLIMFFVVTAAIEQEVVDEQVELAKAKYIKEVETVNPNRITINIRKDGSIRMGIAVLSEAQLENILMKTHSVSKDTEIILRASGKLDYRSVDRIIEVIKRSQLTRIKIAAFKE